MKQGRRIVSSPGSRTCSVVGLLISCLLALSLYRSDDAKIREEFSHEIDSYASSITAQINEDIAVLYSLRALFDASDVVTRVEFQTFASFLLARYPSIRALGWVPRVSADERSTVEAQARNDGFPGFQISERRVRGGMVRAGPRDDLYPVYFIEPLADNHAALGYDLASDRIRREALQLARDTGEAHATGRIRLVQEDTASGAAVLIFVPVYEGASTSASARRDSICGVVSGVVPLYDLLAAARADAGLSELINVRILDETADDTTELLYESALGDSDLAATYRQESHLKRTAGRQWQLVATPSTAYVSERRANLPYISLLIGIIITAWLSYYVARMAHEQQRVEQQVHERTLDLQKQSAALVESNAKQTQEIAERKLLQKQFADVVDHEQRRLGQELHDSLGQQIAVMAMMSQGLQRRVAAEDATAVDFLERLTESTQTAQAQVRALSKGLLPVEVDRGGLTEALEVLVASVKGLSDVDVLCRCEDDVVVGDDAVATHLYRIAQEALRNALEHGDVSRATISLSCDGSHLEMAIRDDGRGLGEKESISSGSGRSIMNHRADLIGATLEVETREGEGTSIVCRLPCATPVATCSACMSTPSVPGESTDAASVS